MGGHKLPLIAWLGVLALVLGGCTARASAHVVRPVRPMPGSSVLPSNRVLVTTSTTPPVRPPAYPQAFGVGIRSVTFVDRSRTTLDYAFHPPRVLAPYRVIVTTVRYPTLVRGTPPVLDAPPATQFGPFPVIVFAHGYAVAPHTYEPLLDAWVRAGFVVIAPLFPVDNYYEWVAQGQGSAPEADIWNEPMDVSFALRGIASLAHQPSSFLDGLIDLSKMAFAGQSDGANVMAGLVYGNRFWRARSELPARPLAMALLSGAEMGRGVVYSAPSPGPALLFSQSTTDYCNSTQSATQLFNAVAGTTRQRYFLSLDRAPHLGPYDGQLPWFSSVSQVTTQFFELELGARDRHASPATIESAGNADGVSALTIAAEITLPPTGDEGNCGKASPDP
ncbi:MAG: hypothetical protein ACYDGN_08200 [Acidimicrobiales bacterium]